MPPQLPLGHVRRLVAMVGVLAATTVVARATPFDPAVRPAARGGHDRRKAPGTDAGSRT